MGIPFDGSVVHRDSIVVEDKSEIDPS